jgi:hypothetical protein
VRVRRGPSAHAWHAGSPTLPAHCHRRASTPRPPRPDTGRAQARPPWRSVRSRQRQRRGAAATATQTSSAARAASPSPQPTASRPARVCRRQPAPVRGQPPPARSRQSTAHCSRASTQMPESRACAALLGVQSQDASPLHPPPDLARKLSSNPQPRRGISRNGPATRGGPTGRPGGHLCARIISL